MLLLFAWCSLRLFLCLFACPSTHVPLAFSSTTCCVANPAGNVSDLAVLEQLFVVREGLLLGQLLAAMKGASGDQVRWWRRHLVGGCQQGGTVNTVWHTGSIGERKPHSKHTLSVPCKQVFDIWMRQQSDTVQHTATAFAEREVLSACLRTLRGGGVSASLRTLLEPVVRLYALYRLEQVGGQVGVELCRSGVGGHS